MTSPRGLVRPLCNVAQARYIPSLIAAQVLTWCIAHRDQAGIAKDLIYVMRIVAGLAFFWHIHSVILRSQPLMRVVGFNGTQIRNGTAQRGKKTSCDPPAKQNAEDNIRGPLCPDSIAAYIQAISADALERFFNCVISILAAKSFFPQKIDALLDSSEIQSTQTCEGCGKVSKEKAPQLRHRKGRIRKVMETVFGFKLWVIWDPVSGLPLAIRFATIEHKDALSLLETGIRKFRQKVKEENGNKLIVFDENRYAIFDTYEVIILCGRTVLMPTGVPRAISKRDILLKYGALLE